MSRRRSRAGQLDVAFYSPWIGPLLRNVGTPTGGAETQIFLIAKTLAARGFSVCIITYDTQPPLPKSVDGVPIRLVRKPRSRFTVIRGLVHLWSLLTILSVMRSRAVVHRSAGPLTGVVAVAARLALSRFVYSSANVVDFDYERVDPSRLNARLFHLGVRLANQIVVQTDEQVALCRARFGKEPRMIKSVAEPFPERSNTPEAFLWAGRLAHYKRPEAFVNLARALPEARFRMVAVPPPPEANIGDTLVHGSDPASLDLLRSADATLPNFELLDPLPRSELLTLIQSAVAVVNTSDYEGMPNVFLEGWSRGVPALALSHDPDGVIAREGLGKFAHGSSDRFVELAHELWIGRQDQAELGRRCREYIASEHAADAVATQWAEALELAVGKKERR
jgi:glycosyltransferase involved in cell wall biosynthesis